MSYLGTILELDDGSRLTGVGLRPLARELSHQGGTVYLHLVMLPAGGDATTASGAAATFMPATLATIDGNLNRPGMSGELIRWKDHSHGTSLEVPARAA
jgi:hypothetical protein